jgi:molecular chaperone GrpE
MSETPEPTPAPEAEEMAIIDTSAERIAALEAEVAAMKDQALRALAEAENLRRRTDREKEDAQKYAVLRFARDLVTVADDLARAIAAAPTEGEAAANLIEGVAATERALISTFERHGIRRVDPQLGERFDPNIHEAMFEMPSADQPAGTVLQVVRAGFVINDRLLRAAQVGVSKGGEGAQKVDTTA